MAKSATTDPSTSSTAIITGRPTADNINTALKSVIKSQQLYIDGELKRLQDQVEYLRKTDLEELKLELENQKKAQQESTFRAIEIVGIFSALLGFIVFEAQIFKATQSTLTLVGLTLVMLGALTFFVLLLDLAFDAFKSARRLRPLLFGFSVACIASGFLTAYIGYKNGDFNLYLTKEEVIAEIDKRINESQNATTTTIIQKDDTQLLEFKNCILKSGLARCL